MFGVRPKKNEKPGAHLPFTHNALEAVRTYVNVTCKGKGVHPRLIANFDQVWCTLHRPAKSVRQKDPTWRGLTKDPMARSLQMRRVRHHLENALNLRFTEPNPDCKDAHQRSSMPEVSGGATATAPVDAWRTPRTLTTLSFIDGYVARGYITVKAGGISEANRELLNQSLSKYLYIEDPQEGTHIWNEKSLIRYLSFLAEEVRARRKSLGLTARHRALVMLDQAAAHMSSSYRRIQAQWSEQHNIETQRLLFSLFICNHWGAFLT